VRYGTGCPSRTTKTYALACIGFASPAQLTECFRDKACNLGYIAVRDETGSYINETIVKNTFATITCVGLLSLLAACSNLNRGHEEALNQASGIEVMQGRDGVKLRLPEKVLFDFDQCCSSVATSR
jgi:hypothetical protein